jgi:hypothetical protein
MTLTLILLFALADRLAGGDYIARLQAIVAADAARWRAPRWISVLAVEIVNARSTFWASIALAGLMALLGALTPFGPKLALLAIGFAAWRWEGWTVFGGQMDPKTQLQRIGLLERHLLALPAVLPILIWLCPAHRLEAGFFGAGALAAFAIWATLVGCILAAEERRAPGLNTPIELLRGAGLGLAVAVTLAVGA